MPSMAPDGAVPCCGTGPATPPWLNCRNSCSGTIGVVVARELGTRGQSSCPRGARVPFEFWSQGFSPLPRPLTSSSPSTPWRRPSQRLGLRITVPNPHRKSQTPSGAPWPRGQRLSLDFKPKLKPAFGTMPRFACNVAEERLAGLMGFVIEILPRAMATGLTPPRPRRTF